MMQLVQQALVAKAFNIQRISIFILNSEPSSNDPNSPVMGGVFASYGENF